MTITGVPSASSRMSCTCTRFGCTAADAARASRRKRRTTSGRRCPFALRNFSASGLRVASCRAAHTEPIPPSPRNWLRRYRSATNAPGLGSNGMALAVT
jgi:hypothetical protein